MKEKADKCSTLRKMFNHVLHVILQIKTSVSIKGGNQLMNAQVESIISYKLTNFHET